MPWYKVIAIFSTTLFVSGCQCNVRFAPPQRAAEERARSQVRAWAEKLDANTTVTGSYIRPQAEELPEIDPWGKTLRVNYTNEGVAEKLTVRSAGPDKTFFTDDDIDEVRMTGSLEGTAEVVKKNIGEVSKEGAKGTVKGILEGAAEGVKEAVARDKSTGDGKEKESADRDAK
jgi:hypothetical protein